MLHRQIIWSVCDYSFADSEVYTFLLPADKRKDFVSLYNKGIEEHQAVHTILEQSGELVLPKTYSFLKAYQSDDNILSLGEYA